MLQNVSAREEIPYNEKYLMEVLQQYSVVTREVAHSALFLWQPVVNYCMKRRFRSYGNILGSKEMLSLLHHVLDT